jgi:aryl-alcohol dehydrogenase
VNQKGSNAVQVVGAVSKGAEAPFVLTDLELDAPRADEILVRTVAAGVCNSDLSARRRFPGGAVLGHEGAGVVEAVGDGVTSVATGDHVVLSFHSCGRCPACLRGRPYRCARFAEMNFAGTRPDGSSTLRDADGVVGSHFFGQSSFATRVLAYERNTVSVDPAIPLDLVAPLGCGVGTGAGTVLNALRPEAGSSLSVFGAGSVGLSALLAAVVQRCNPILAIDVVPERLALAAELGATHTFDGRDPDLLAKIREVTSGGTEYAVETSGLPAVLRTAVSSVIEGGTVAVVGIEDVTGDVTLGHYELLMGRTVMGVTEGNSVPQLFIPHLIDLWQRGDFPFDRFIRHYSFEEIQTAVEDSSAGRSIKPVLRF